MKRLLLAMMLALSGCAGSPSGMRAVRVEVPMLVPCKTEEVVSPAWAASGIPRSDPLEVKIRALWAERRQRIGYERELLAATRACQ